jgi:UDP-N-acetylglucosamine--N-acetylmuramyl-(pentapeptide) pyrophosphoryl-undecaprenol N-acetylglucosamine transferase
VTAGGGLLVDDDALTPAWVVDHVLPVLTDPGRLQAMAGAAARAGSRDADTVLARYVLNLVSDLVRA